MTTTAPPRRRVFGTPRGIVLLLLLTATLMTSVYPMRRYFDVRAQITALKAEEVRLDARAADLQRQKELLETDEQIEALARENLGYVRPGEIPFVVARPADSGDEPSALDQRPVEQTIVREPVLSRAFDVVVRVIGSPL